MTPPRGPTSIPARTKAAVALVCLAVLVAGCRTSLYSGLQEREANEMLALLLQNGIAAHRVESGDQQYALEVDERSIAKAVTVLKAGGYPKDDYQSIGDVFKGDGFILSPTEERARFIYATSEELSRTISEIDEVLSARVHVVLPSEDPLQRESKPSSAAVFVRHSAKNGFDGNIPKIKRLVANSIEGLSYENVSVVLTKAGTATTDLSKIAPQPSPALLPGISGTVQMLATLLFGIGLGITALSYRSLKTLIIGKPRSIAPKNAAPSPNVRSQEGPAE